jgi:ankyrin repeat protein
MSSTVQECEAAMRNVEIDDDSLVAIFRSCGGDAKRLFHRAVRTNNERALLTLVKRFDVKQLFGEDHTLLALAYKNANLRIIDALVAAGMRADVPDQFDALPWHSAAYNTDETVMARLLADGVDVNAVDATGASLAHKAAVNDNANVLAMLIANGANVMARDGSLNTPLHWAVSMKNAATATLLIPLCDVNARNDEGRTPCMCATRTGNSIALELLIGAGADVHAVDDFDETALTKAVRLTDEKSVELLVDANADVNAFVPIDGTTAMHLAAMWCNHRLLGKLIAAGGNVKASDRLRRTPCHMVSEANDPKGDGAARSMAMLIAAGADVNAMDFRDQTPLHHAAIIGCCDCISLLLKAGANVRARDEDGASPLHLVKNVGSAVLLVDAKADVNAVDCNGNSVCRRMWDHPQVLSFLISAGANVLSAGSEGQTVLHIAAMNENSVESMSVLINAGVDVNQDDNSGNCAGHLAARCGLVENLNFLLSHGARINQRNNVGETMLFAAAAADRATLQTMAVLIDAGADVLVTNEVGASVAHGANASALPLLRSLGVNLNGVDDGGNTPCHVAPHTKALVALFALGATMTSKNKAGLTPYETILSKSEEDDVEDQLVTFVAAGIDIVGVKSHFAVVILYRQMQLFRLRALKVCIGLQSLRVSALELCEILSNMFAPLESVVPFGFAWEVVCAVKHKQLI